MQDEQASDSPPAPSDVFPRTGTGRALGSARRQGSGRRRPPDDAPGWGPEHEDYAEAIRTLTWLGY